MMNLQQDFPLTSRVGQGCSNQAADLVLVQMSLSLLKRSNGQSYYHGRIDGRCGPKLTEAIDLFFADQGFAAPNAIQPQSQAHQRLAALVKERLAREPKAPAPYLTFNGKRLCWIGKPHNGKCWEAVSGAVGYQAAEHQSLPDKGPIPEGTWRVRQDQYQKYDDVPLYKRLEGIVGGGTWPGGSRAWGNHRVWLLPKSVSNTYGRSGFSIHGGTVPGSAGCLDLTYNMRSFAEAFGQYGGDLDLVVKYDK